MANPRMTPDARAAFLADVHVGVLAVAEPGRGPCAVPVWYRYTPGEAIRITTSPTSRKARLLRAAGRASLCVQTERLPYQYVSVEGPIEFVETDVSTEQRVIAHRYMGEKLGEQYLKSKAFDLSDEVLLLLYPERWWSVDFSQVALNG